MPAPGRTQAVTPESNTPGREIQSIGSHLRGQVMRRSVHRTVALLATVCGFVLYFTDASAAAPAARPAGILATTLVNKTGTTITVTAGVGRGNSITVGQTGNSITVRDTGDTVAASGGCTAISTTEVACTAADTTELVVNAGDQNDNVTSSLGNLGVTLIGGAGDDNLYGGSANDTLEGDEGSDFLSGGAGNDTLTGGADADRIFGGAGNDSIEGRSGSDVINGSSGNDVIDGGTGNEQIVAGAGNDYADGGSGRDTIDAVDNVSGNDYVEGGADVDDCRADLGDAVSGCP
ncbi:calcium-binding protein [Streptomyces sp. NPDC051636]|uniref:calcium-binding protein n=1 Tax=Streptomyces sp. NPDC051636 TaxID=3365663 RepID=UPI0037BE1EEB